MNEQPNNGGPAFPIKGYCADASGALCGEVITNHGMSLRDYFAAMAMQGIVSTDQGQLQYTSEVVAGWAYQIADAMLTRRPHSPTQTQ